jgi:phosphoserine phosphatase
MSPVDARKIIVHKGDLTECEKALLLEKLPGELSQRGGYYCLRRAAIADPAVLEDLRRRLALDINALPVDFRAGQVRLFVTDMDSTFIAIECIDELADLCDLKAQVAAITEAAMRGEMDFPTALKKRVALLQGLPVSALQRVYDERLRLNPGARELLTELKRRDIKTALVSGGFTFFTDSLKQCLGFDFTLANELEIIEGRLTGNTLGPIVGAPGKARFLLELCRQQGIEARQTIAVGDGANDLEMLARAGLSVAYHAKPIVRSACSIVLDYSGLDALNHILDAS